MIDVFMVDVDSVDGSVRLWFRESGDPQRRSIGLTPDGAEQLMNTLNEELPPVIARLRETEYERRKRRIKELRDELAAMEASDVNAQWHKAGELITERVFDDMRTVAAVIAERQNAIGGGCCERFGNQQRCDCLSRATARERASNQPCSVCRGRGYTGSPNNGRNSTMVRCPAGCPVRCGICRNPDCDNPNGQH